MNRYLSRGCAALLCAALMLAGTACGKAADSESQPASEIADYTPTVESDNAYVQQLQAAIGENPDTVAWLVIPGTDTNEAVVQAEDNDYYLRRNALGEEERWGCTFSDCVNLLTSREALHTNSILYGHSHNSEDTDLPQFTQLFRYLDEDFLTENPAFYLYLPDGDELVFQIAAVFYTDTGFDYIEPFPEDAYYETLSRKNEYTFENVAITSADKLMTLSTCSYKYDTNETGNHRFVVVGKLLPQGSEPVTPAVMRNESPERPQA